MAAPLSLSSLVQTNVSTRQVGQNGRSEQKPPGSSGREAERGGRQSTLSERANGSHLAQTVLLTERSISERQEDVPRPGKPSQMTARQRCQMGALACEHPNERPMSHGTGTESAEDIMRRRMVEQMSPRHAARLFKKGISNRTCFVRG
jgi:hypothetical protein